MQSVCPQIGSHQLKPELPDHKIRPRPNTQVIPFMSECCIYPTLIQLVYNSYTGPQQRSVVFDGVKR